MTIAAPSDDRFDLVCSGNEHFVTLGKDRVEPFEITFHIDLEERKWCQGTCGVIDAIHNVQPAIL
ncbi:MAG: hypothetical protein V4502_13180, partial [Pseudomonadota bacterium]